MSQRNNIFIIIADIIFTIVHKRRSESHPGYGRNWVYCRKSQSGHRRHARQVVVRRRRRRTFANCHPRRGREDQEDEPFESIDIRRFWLEEFGFVGVLRDLADMSGVIIRDSSRFDA